MKQGCSGLVDGVMVWVQVPKLPNGYYVIDDKADDLAIYGWEGNWLGDQAAPGSFRPPDPDRARQSSGVKAVYIIAWRGDLSCGTGYYYGDDYVGTSQWFVPKRLPGASRSFWTDPLGSAQGAGLPRATAPWGEVRNPRAIPLRYLRGQKRNVFGPASSGRNHRPAATLGRRRQRRARQHCAHHLRRPPLHRPRTTYY